MLFVLLLVVLHFLLHLLHLLLLLGYQGLFLLLLGLFCQSYDLAGPHLLVDRWGNIAEVVRQDLLTDICKFPL
jgi:hypothetical protein